MIFVVLHITEFHIHWPVVVYYVTGGITRDPLYNHSTILRAVIITIV
jgi:hypothetical protein